MPEVTVTVPGDHAELFQREAAFTLEMAADCVHREARRDTSEPDELDDLLVDLKTAKRFYEQAQAVPTCEIRVESPSGEWDALRLTLDGCLLNAEKRVSVALEAARRPGWVEDARLAIEELVMWLALRESVEGEA
jgi:hypothetical protein